MNKKPTTTFGRNFFTVLSIVFLLGIVFFVFTQNTKPLQQVPMSQLIKDVEAGRIDKITIQGNRVVAQTKDNLQLVTYKEASQGLADYGITSDKVTIDITNPDASQNYTTILSILLPILVIGFFLWLLTRQARGGQSQAMSFGRTSARTYQGDKRVTFADVAGLVSAKQELSEVVEFLKNPKKFHALGAEIPRGVLLYGPAGVGKTMLAKAVAGEASVPFMSLSASEFVEMFVGVGASRVRDLFTRAKKTAPTVIFIDELDAVGRQRGAGLGGSHDEREQTLNQILVEMDGFDTETSVIVLAATNRPDVLDPALLRPGRFDRKVALDLPDRSERLEILKIHTRNKPISANVNLEEVARTTPGLSGAELKNVVNEAAIFAARENKKKIEQREMRSAIEKVIIGPERTSHVMGEKERRIVAYHEAGHAIIGHALHEDDMVHKVSIVSRGMALGYTLSLPNEDRRLISRSHFINEITTLLGGRAAEELIFKDVTTGASNDLERATSIARNMVTVYGMSPLGPIKMGEREEMVFLGRDMGMHKQHSEQLSAKIDSEISRIIEGCWESSKQLLKKYNHVLEAMSVRLLEVETLEDDELNQFFAMIDKDGAAKKKRGA